MTSSEIIQQLLRDLKATRWQEWASTVMQVASVWYAKKNNVLVYPTGIVGVILAAYVYAFMCTPPLYADASLNIYYFVMSIYGWYNWSLKKDAAEKYPISYCTSGDWKIGLMLFVVFWVSIYLVLSLTNSNTLIMDSLVSATAVTAMWWMAKRKVENWWAWIVSNIVAIPLNFYKGFMLFTLMYVLFLILAVMGWQEWKQKVNVNKS